jgi:multidrug efflux system outer membrane protein
LQAAEARAQAAAARYRQTIVNAIHEIEGDLSSLHYLEQQSLAVGLAVDSARDLVHLSRVQYDGGFGSYLEVVESERGLLSLLRSDLDISVQKYLAVVGLIRNTGLN